MISSALSALRKGQPIVLYDGDDREGEADLIFHAKYATPKKIAQLRTQAGGLICVALDRKIAKKISLPFFTDLIDQKFKLSKIRCKKTAYGDKPAFSIPVNHKNVYTGITDNDRALTIHNLAKLVQRNNGIAQDFTKNFYTPGHVFLLIGRGIKNRRGHTELSLELAQRAGLPGVMVLCEMLGKGRALSKARARTFAKKHKLIFVEGKEI